MTRTPTTRPEPVSDFEWRPELKRLRRKKSKRKTKAIYSREWQGYLDAVRGFLKSGDWTGANSRHLVALHAILHECVYAVADGDLSRSAARVKAWGTAATLTKRDFGGRLGPVIDYVRWAWTREEQREKWRRDNRASDRPRLSWYRLFNGSLVTEYRVERARNHGSHDAGG